MLHSIAFAPIEDLKRPFVAVQPRGLQDGHGYQRVFAGDRGRHAARVMPAGGRSLTLTYFGGERVVPGLQHDGRLQGRTRRRRQVPGVRPGAQEDPGQRSSAGPVKTLAASAVGDSDKLAGLYEMSSPLDRNITREEVGAAGMFLLSDLASGITGEILHVDCGYNVMGSPGRAIERVKHWCSRRSRRPTPRWRPCSKRTTSSSDYERPAENSRSRSGSASSAARTGSWSGAGRHGTVYAGYWEFPGGKCEPGESPAAATARECLEETGLTRRRRLAQAHDDSIAIPTASSSCISTTARPTDPASEPADDSGFCWVAAASSPRFGSRKPTRRSSKSWPDDSASLMGTGLGLSGIAGSRSTTLSIRP